ncbi:MAG: hypothetical protein CMJ28_05370 [Phycisphaerae bacterium]|nr:hypothetical protein [Phycisphaerae bacterium]
MTMDCENFDQYRDAFLDGRLSSDQARSAEQHLANCPKCQVEIEHLLATESHLRDQVEPAWTEQMTQVVLNQTTAPIAQITWPWQVATAAGWLLAIGLGLQMLRPSGSPDSVAQPVAYYQPAPWMKSTLGPRREVEAITPLVQMLGHLQTGSPPSAVLLEDLATMRQTAFGENRILILEAEAACAHLLQPARVDLETLFPGLSKRLQAAVSEHTSPQA